MFCVKCSFVEILSDAPRKKFLVDTYGFVCIIAFGFDEQSFEVNHLEEPAVADLELAFLSP